MQQQGVRPFRRLAAFRRGHTNSLCKGVRLIPYRKFCNMNSSIKPFDSKCHQSTPCQVAHLSYYESPLLPVQLLLLKKQSNICVSNTALAIALIYSFAIKQNSFSLNF